MTTSRDSEIQADLVYDVGCHDGVDTAYYLRCGYRVVAVDASGEMTRRLERAFEDAIRRGRLTVVHGAVVVAGGPGTATLYVSEQSEWTSLVPSIAGRGEVGVSEIEVPTTTIRDLVQRFGTPHYLKIDIEGMDEVALEDLASTGARPTYISVEAEAVGDAGTTDAEALRKLELLANLGYSRFKLVDQDSLRVLSAAAVQLGPHRSLGSRLRRRLGRPPRERRHVLRLHGRRLVFPLGATGPFGPDLAGEWYHLDQARELLVATRRAYFQREDARAHGFWCDWHASK